MANIPIIDVTGGTAYTKGTGAGLVGDPYVPQPNVSGTVNIGGGTVVASGTIDAINGTVPTRTTNNGTVSVSNFPATQPISGTVGVSGTVPVQITNNGTVSVSNLPATQAISGTVGVSGTVPTLEQGGTTNIAGTPTIQPVRTTIVPTLTTVVAGTASGTILASNANRRGATIYNDSTANMYLLLGTAAASVSSMSLLMAGASYYEVPFNYAGQIMGAWTAANGTARITELT